MEISSLLVNKKCPFALEIFPPKRHSKVESVYGMIGEMGEVAADYISVTYSAGGDGAKEYTAKIATYIQETQNKPALAHLTCATQSKDEIKQRLQELKDGGIKNILALRGDDAASSGDYHHAVDLVREIADFGGFYIVGACYPEAHPESESVEKDIEYLKQKKEAGVGHFVSQLFFDNDKFYTFLENTKNKGMHCPIEAGIMPLTQPGQLERMISLSSASVPASLSKWVSLYNNDSKSFYKAGIEYTVLQIRDLIENNVSGIHLYAMNKPGVVKDIYDNIKDLL